ncbi:MAG TPA: aminopeptidase [Limnochordia bacterium]|nr:aminopeptidase [Limnochordia bacterium]
MQDPRLVELAKLIVGHSVALAPGERLLIENFGVEIPFVQALIDAAYEAGGVPFVQLREMEIMRTQLLGATEAQMRAEAEWDGLRMSRMDAYVGVRSWSNAAELADLPPEKLRLKAQFWDQPVHTGLRIPGTKWCVLRYPNRAMAQAAGSSLAAFEDFYFRVCLVDYARMAKQMAPLVELMAATDRVHLVGPGTDLRFSIKGIPIVPCAGNKNIPDGEVFTAPVRDSVQGHITFNTPSLKDGVTFERIRLRFEHGRIVEASAAQENERLQALLDTDEGARYVGEFSLGVNPHILHPMKDTLFDEKIAGSFHLTPGNAYEEADNHNRSALHWDLVNIQRPEYGGGEIYFDDVLVRKDGRFVLAALQGLDGPA